MHHTKTVPKSQQISLVTPQLRFQECKTFKIIKYNTFGNAKTLTFLSNSLKLKQHSMPKIQTQNIKPCSLMH